MNIRFLCIFIFLMCAFTAGIVNAHTLHVGDKTFALSQTKYTTPSLAFGVGNEVWYAPLARVFINDSLHLRVGSTTYSVINCAEGFVDTENYTYDENGRLIGADENLWIKAGGGYIDTEFIANGDTRIKTKMYIAQKKFFFCIRQALNNSAFCFLWGEDNYLYTDYGTQRTKSVSATPGIYIIDKNKNITKYTHPNGNMYTINQSKQTFTTPVNMLILATRNNPEQISIMKDNTKIYYFQIWDNDVLVRDMVPVPACMRIGDFIVPENGMWDIVEQKFYGNSGTGSFIYGKDE